MTYSFIFQAHNRQDTVRELLQPFIDAQNQGFDCELIICNDGSNDNTQKEISLLLDIAKFRERNFAIEMFDAHETELTYRAIKLSEGEIVCLLQDDDFYSDMQFVTEAKRLFNVNAELVALSPKHGMILDGKMNIKTVYSNFSNTTDIATKAPEFVDNLCMVDIVDRAPFIFKRSEYEKIGGLDRDLLRAGYNDWDLCLRWKKINLKVGIFYSPSYQFRKWYAGSLANGAQTHIKLTENHGKVFRKHY